MSKGDKDMLDKSVIGYWGPMHSPSFGVVIGVADDGMARIRWEDDDGMPRTYPVEDIKPNWFTAEYNDPGIYIYDDGSDA